MEDFTFVFNETWEFTFVCAFHQIIHRYNCNFPAQKFHSSLIVLFPRLEKPIMLTNAPK